MNRSENCGLIETVEGRVNCVKKQAVSKEWRLKAIFDFIVTSVLQILFFCSNRQFSL